MSSRQSSTADRPESTGDDLADANATADASLKLPRERRYPWWNRPGVTPRGERILNGIGVAVLVAFAIGWTWSISSSRALPPGTAASGGAIAGGGSHGAADR